MHVETYINIDTQDRCVQMILVSFATLRTPTLARIEILFLRRSHMTSDRKQTSIL